MIKATAVGVTVGEHQREYLYKFSITKDPVITTDIPNYTEMKDNLDLYNTKALVPGHKTDVISQKWAGETYMIMGTDTSTKEGTFDFFQDEDGKCKRFWDGFKQKTGDFENHVVQLKRNIIFNCSVYQVSVDKTTVTAQTDFINCQVSEVEQVSADKEGTKIGLVKVHITWDKAIPRQVKAGTQV